ncbi:ASCH domain-containing protein [Pseudoalteromonas sp. SMS1]|uniref:ASCH domain-containing protein n=1 Tax=Pseudoalteromonas sp. SMS1 TaxID=2908894 RepID=UPI001F329D2A|nr:ASCH domain-containing protein [Pseudoalteromonas sp. SMS1]MCF2856959.1 ASCH domain-containing protein [Pseudoalteromonas sp. SMS1]
MSNRDCHLSVHRICEAYFHHINQPQQQLDSWHFCDNEKDANDCLSLVIAGIKKATSPSLWWYQANKFELPKVGDLNVVTDWDGVAHCIIKTVRVCVIPFDEISADYAILEGEGDKSLAYWRKVHWDYYHRELADTGFTPQKSMPIICEEFEVVYRLKHL